MSRNPLVRRAQEAPYKPLNEVVQFWVRVNKSEATPKTVKVGTATTSTYSIASDDAIGAITEYIVDSEGAHGWPVGRHLTLRASRVIRSLRIDLCGS